MEPRKLLESKMFFYLLVLLMLTLGVAVWVHYTVSPDTLARLSNDVEKWDGSTSASFSGGNGTEENPYTIESGRDLAYFKYVLEKESDMYNGKYYVLNYDIDMNYLPFITIDTDFNGYLDGKGYTIGNFSLLGNKETGLFRSITNATIRNINFENVSIDSFVNSKIGLIAGSANSSNVNHITLINGKISSTHIEDKVGFIFGESKNTELSKIYIEGEITKKSENTSTYYISGLEDENRYSNIYISTSSSIDNPCNSVYLKIDNDYVMGDEALSIDDIIVKLNDGEDSIKWQNYDNRLVYEMLEKPKRKAVRLNLGTRANIIEHDSEVTTNTVYVNDIEADTYYYMGLNYTTSSNKVSIPTMENKELYDETNLVKAEITYSGVGIDNYGISGTGYISDTEAQDEMVYYKVYAVNDNGTTSNKNDDYVTIELIDNPFTKRPNGKAFNGWMTDYYGAFLTLDMDNYTRYVKVPISYENNKPSDIVINFNAQWIDAKVGYTSQSWNTAFNNLDSNGFHEVLSQTTIYKPLNMAGYYLRETAARWSTYYNGYGSDGTYYESRYCTTNGGCTYYVLIEDEEYDSTKTYYQLVRQNNNKMQMSAVNANSIQREVDHIEYLNNPYGLFKAVTVSYGSSLNGYYNSSGTLITNGTCNTWNGCQNYYQLQGYKDQNGNTTTLDANAKYYYITTRDTNIIVLNSNMTSSWTSSNNKHFTLTSLHDGQTYYDNYLNMNGTNVICYADTRLENLYIYSTNSRATNTNSYSNNSSGYFLGSYYNTKIGRGIKRNGNYTNFTNTHAGNGAATGSSTSITKYRFEVEEGHYNIGSITGPITSGTFSIPTYNTYIDPIAYIGNDIDRVSNDNSKLEYYLCFSPAWSANVRSYSNYDFGLYTHFKSGDYGTSHNDNFSGIYVGGRNAGTHYALRGVTIEGGHYYNVVGGPLTTDTKNGDYNDTYIYVKGGEIDHLNAGAGESETYGNRIVQVTGGKFNFSVFGGSNAYSRTSGTYGSLKGSSYLYIGGNAVIGNDDNISNGTTRWNAESGSVFGNGVGNSASTSIGSNYNAYIVIADDAVIKQNVYGGGNYGAVGASVSSGTSTASIKIIGGEIKGSVFGLGNNAGGGKTGNECKSLINVYNGTINGDIYGGANQLGTLLGSTEINIIGGDIKGSIYGGGKGGYQNNTNTGTYVSKNVDITIGNNDNKDIPIKIGGDVYGGSAFGTVGSDSRNPSANSTHVNVTVNTGTITGNVYGGGKGQSTTPTYAADVAGPIHVTINDGSIGSVYGGNNANGTPKSKITVDVNKGTMSNVFGGGNSVGVDDTTVNINGGTITNVYGGSNEKGTVTKNVVNIDGGEIGAVYGGNNAGGTTTESNVNIRSSVPVVYGGGNKAETTTTNVNMISGYVENLFGGGNAAGATTTNINGTGGLVFNMFGGSNSSGIVGTTNIINDFTSGLSNDIEVEFVPRITKTEAWMNTPYKNLITLGIKVKNNSIANLDSYNVTFELADSVIRNNYSNTVINDNGDGTFTFDSTNRYYGKNLPAVGSSYDFEIEMYTNLDEDAVSFKYNIEAIDTDDKKHFAQDKNVQNVYGGNNEGGSTTTTNVTLKGGKYNTIYGGGNQAVTTNNNITAQNGAVIDYIYGGGNLADTNNEVKVNLNDATINTNVFGGGNNADVKGHVYLTLNNTEVKNNVFGAGNLADTNSSISLLAMGKTTIHGNVFGGGNHGGVGSTGNKKDTFVNIVSGNIDGDVYGGCNMAVVTGATNINIGYHEDIPVDDLHIEGTIFGGGNSNESGSALFDAGFISVIDEINVNINGNSYVANNKEFSVSGSIFGSGNASTSSGTSTIYIKDLGTKSHPNINVSLQRSDVVILDNSVIELTGTTDRENEFADYIYSVNRVDLLKLKNNSMLLAQQNTNMLKEFQSLVDVTSGGSTREVPAVVTIDEETGEVTKNVDNRLYTMANKNFNITTNEAASNYGPVTGMTFFGMYTKNAAGAYRFGLYDPTLDNDEIDAADIINGGSYVLGLHSLNHDLERNGFYTNVINEDFIGATTMYIIPEEQTQTFYMWVIGAKTINYEISLIASKYSSLGTHELSLRDFAKGDTEFLLLGFNSEGLKEGKELVDSNNVPKLVRNQEDATKIIGLTMKSETTEWTNYGTTKFTSENNGKMVGDTLYKMDSQDNAPSLMFYLYHAKNISIDEDIGEVVLSLQAKTPVTEIDYKIDLVTVTIRISARSVDYGDAYDAAITYSRKYEMPSSTTVKITNKSQFTTYFSLYTVSDSFDKIYGKNDDNYHAIISNYVFPVGTKITMLDYGTNEVNPDVYYYIVTESSYAATQSQFATLNEAVYPLSSFIKMGSTSTSNVYNDSIANHIYYDDDTGFVLEEFLFIFDLEETDGNSTSQGNYTRLELRNGNDTLINVLGLRQDAIRYDLYQSSNIALEQGIELPSEYLYPNSDLTLPYTTTVAYDQTDNRETVIDTNYEANSMGLNMYITDSSGNDVSSTLLEDTTISIDDVLYHADSNGVFRIKLAGKVSTLIKTLNLHVGNALPQGHYTIKFKLFASEDGLYSTGNKEVISPFDVELLDTNNAIDVDLDSEYYVINMDKGLPESIPISFSYESDLSHPNIRVTMYKRNISAADDINFTEISPKELFTNDLVSPGVYGLVGMTRYELMITNSPTGTLLVNFLPKEEVMTGTYKFSFMLYTDNFLVDTVEKYIIIKNSSD